MGRASLHYPITSGNSFWTEPQANGALEVGANRLYLGGSTELDLDTLNEKSSRRLDASRWVYLRLATASDNEQYVIDTSRGVVNISEPGSYEILAGDADNPTIVTVVKGAAEFVANNVHLSIGPQQSAAIWVVTDVHRPCPGRRFRPLRQNPGATLRGGDRGGADHAAGGAWHSATGQRRRPERRATSLRPSPASNSNLMRRQATHCRQ